VDTEVYPLEGFPLSPTLTQAKHILKGTFYDPIVQTLLKYSNLTQIQFESLLISALGEDATGKPLIGREKVRLRLSRTNLTRGSFNRTVAQARKNVVASIYTILLLGYTGLFDQPELEPFLEVSSRIKSYVDQRKASREMAAEEQTRVMRLIGDELRRTVEDLAHGVRRQEV
jgi:hypothetical protein